MSKSADDFEQLESRLNYFLEQLSLDPLDLETERNMKEVENQIKQLRSQEKHRPQNMPNTQQYVAIENSDIVKPISNTQITQQGELKKEELNEATIIDSLKISTKESEHYKLNNGVINLAKDYKIDHFLDDEDVKALAEYEYALLSSKTVLQSRQELKLINIIDFPKTLGWSIENKNWRKDIIESAISHAASGTPQFFIVADGLHIITVALLPDLSSGIIQIIYMNSAYGEGSDRYIASKMTGLEFLRELIGLTKQIDNPNDQDQPQKPQAIISQICLNPTQQIINNCGVMAALNIAELLSYWKSKGGMGLDFNEFGNKIVGAHYNILLSISNMHEKILQFEAYAKAKFQAIVDLDITTVPVVLLQELIIAQTAITFDINQLEANTIFAMQKDLIVQGAVKTEAIDFSSIESLKIIDSDYIKIMICEIVDRHRKITGENIDQQYTQEELEQAYNVLIYENEKLLKSVKFSTPASSTAKTDTDITMDHKSHDLMKLENICTLIDNFNALNSFSDEASTILNEIGISARIIRHNQNREGYAEYIRNKYSSINESDDTKARVREDGLELIHLAALEKIAGKISQGIVVSALPELKENLKNIQEKIKLIIKAEREISTKTVTEVLSEFKKYPTINFQKFVNYFYSVEIIEELVNVIEDPNLSSLDFFKREDRYYFGRILSIIGELSKDFKIFTKTGKEGDLFSFFKNIRNKDIAHKSSVMVPDVTQEQKDNLNILINLLARNFKAILKDIKEFFGKITLSQDSSEIWDAIKKLQTEFGNLEEMQKNELNKLRKAIFNMKDIPIDTTKLYAIDQKASAPLEKKDKYEKEVRDRIIVVNDLAATINNIIIKVEKIATLPQKKEKLINVIKKEISKLVFSYNEVADSDEVKFPIDVGIPSLELLSDIKGKLEEKVKVIAVTKQEESEAKIRQNESDDDEDNEKDVGNKGTSNTQLVPKELNKQVSEKLAVVSKELAYMVSIIDNKQITGQKKDFIIQFSYSKIGQLARDIDVKQQELLTNLTHEGFSSSMIVTMSTRNKLMHEMLKIDTLGFSKALYRHTLPMVLEIEALRQIFDILLDESIVINTNPSALLSLGRAYTILKKYDRAYECFENILKISGDKMEKALNADIVNREDFKILSDIPNAHLAFAIALGKDGDDSIQNNKEKAYELYQHKIVHLERYIQLLEETHLELKNQLASAYNNLGNTYSNIQDFDNAIKNNKKAVLLLEKCEFNATRTALYLANLGTSYFHHIRYQIELAVTKESDISEAIGNNPLAVACLWEVKQSYEKAGVKENSAEYIRVTAELIQALLYSGDHKVCYARKLFNELKDIVAIFPAREGSQEILVIDQLAREIKQAYDALLSNEPQLLERYSINEDLLYVEFEFTCLQHIRIFYIDMGITMPSDLTERLTDLQAKLAKYDPSQISIETKFTVEVLSINDEASVLLKKGKFEEALNKYLIALKKLNSEEYKIFSSEVIGDLLESIGDTYSALDQPKLAIEKFKESLIEHTKHGPNDRAFCIPKKIVEQSGKLARDRNEELKQEIKFILDSFKNKVGNHDLRLIPIKKLLISIYLVLHEYAEAIILFKEIGERNLSEGDKGLWREAEYKINEEMKSTVQTELIEHAVISGAEKVSLVSKFHKNPEGSFNIQVGIKGIGKKDFEAYCKSQLGITAKDLDYDGVECWISLDKKNIALLLNKLTAQSATKVYYCDSIICENPILNDKKIGELLKLANSYFGMKGVNKLIDIGLISEKYQRFQKLREELGDERAIKLYFSLELTYIPATDLMHGIDFSHYETMNLDASSVITKMEELQKDAVIVSSTTLINIAKQSYNFGQQPQDQEYFHKFIDKMVNILSDSVINIGSTFINVMMKYDYIRYKLISYAYHDELLAISTVISKPYIQLSTAPKIQSVLQKYPLTWDKNDFNQIKLVVHPDKGGRNEDFLIVNFFQKQLGDKDHMYQNLLPKLLPTIQTMILKANIGFKMLDTIIDSGRLVYEPTFQNAKKLVLDSAYLYSMFSGVNRFVGAITGSEALYQISLGECAQAFKTVAITIAYMALPKLLTYTAVPHLGLAYGIGMVAYTGYSAITNSHSFYLERNNDAESTYRSAIAYKDLMQAFSKSPLQKLYDFATIAKVYEIWINNAVLELEKTAVKTKLEEQGVFGQKLYEYIYEPTLEERYDLSNKILQGRITKEEAETLKAKHIKISSGEQSYEHCMEIRDTANDRSNDGTDIAHYYCYNEEKEVLDHIVIGNTNIQVIEHLV